jgi:hypothetical protein
MHYRYMIAKPSSSVEAVDRCVIEQITRSTSRQLLVLRQLNQISNEYNLPAMVCMVAPVAD